MLSLRLIEDMVPDFRWELTKVLAVAETHVAAVMQAHGNATVSDGGEVALRYGQISVVRDGQVLVTECSTRRRGGDARALRRDAERGGSPNGACSRG